MFENESPPLRARISVRVCATEEEPEACQVWLEVGVQSFQVGTGHSTIEEGQWFADQLLTAVARMGAEGWIVEEVPRNG